MRAVLIWNSGFGKKELLTEGGRRRRGQYCWGFALRWAGTVSYTLCRCYGTARFHLWNLGYRCGGGRRGGEGRGGEGAASVLDLARVNRRGD